MRGNLASHGGQWRHLSRQVFRLVFGRDEAYYDESELKQGEDGEKAVATGHARRVGRGRELLLQTVRLPGQAHRPLRAVSGVHRPRCPAQRGHELRQRRPERPLGVTHHLRLGHSGTGQRPPHHVCLGRCADQLHYRDRLSRYGQRELQEVLARRRPHDRQGHRALPRGLLAGLPDVGGPAASQTHLRPRLHAVRRHQDVEVARQCRCAG